MFSPGDMTVSANQSGCNSGDACEYEAEVPTSVCSTDISVTISAANRLGQGPPSQPYLFGKLYCVNIIHVTRQCHKIAVCNTCGIIITIMTLGHSHPFFRILCHNIALLWFEEYYKYKKQLKIICKGM